MEFALMSPHLSRRPPMRKFLPIVVSSLAALSFSVFAADQANKTMTDQDANVKSNSDPKVSGRSDNSARTTRGSASTGASADTAANANPNRPDENATAGADKPAKAKKAKKAKKDKGASSGSSTTGTTTSGAASTG